MPTVKVKVSIVLNNTGMRNMNGQEISSEVSTKNKLSDIVGIGIKRYTVKNWIIQNFKEDLEEMINDSLLDQCKGHKWSISRSTKFNDWLEKQEVTFEIL